MIKYQIFYAIKPYIPRRFQIFLRRQLATHKLKKYAHIWPIDHKAGHAPEGWKGWPNGKRFALMLSHDMGARIAEIHTWLGDAILWVAGLHALAAIYHHAVIRDGVLVSMLPRWLPVQQQDRR